MKDRMYLKIKNADISDMYQDLVYLEKLKDMESQTWVDSMFIDDPLSCISLFAGSGRNKKFLSFHKNSFIEAFLKCVESSGYEVTIVKKEDI